MFPYNMMVRLYEEQLNRTHLQRVWGCLDLPRKNSELAKIYLIWICYQLLVGKGKVREARMPVKDTRISLYGKGGAVKDGRHCAAV